MKKQYNLPRKLNMAFYFHYPKPNLLQRFLQSQATQPLAYREAGQSKAEFPKGYNHDRNEIFLGEGKRTFILAKRALADWQMFPKHWTNIYPQKTNIQVGENVVVLFRLFGLWWLNASRIVYTIDTPNHYGFAYGTLPAHVERGEECFSIRMDDQGKVWYEIKAFSHPGHWWVWVAYPVARYFQRKFVRDSKAHLFQIVQQVADDAKV